MTVAGFKSKSKGIADALFETNYKTKLVTENWLNLGGREYAIIGKMIRIGRALDNDIVLDDKSCSRYHAHLVIKGNQVTLEDLKSRNGVRVNGKAIRTTALQDNDEVEIGDVKGVFFQKQRTGTRHQKLESKENTVSKAVEGIKQFIADKPSLVSKLKELPKPMKLALLPLAILLPILFFILMNLSRSSQNSSNVIAETKEVVPAELDPAKFRRDAFVGKDDLDQCLELEDLGNYRKARTCFGSLPLNQDVYFALKRVIDTQERMSSRRFEEGERAFENYFYDLAIVKYQEVLLIADEQSEVYRKALEKIKIAEQKKRSL